MAIWPHSVFRAWKIFHEGNRQAFRQHIPSLQDAMREYCRENPVIFDIYYYTEEKLPEQVTVGIMYSQVSKPL